MQAYHRFRQPAQQLLEVNEKICRARPVEEELALQEKTALLTEQETAREVEHFLQLIFSERSKTGRLDLEAIEMAMRSAMHRAVAAELSELVKFDPPDPEQRLRPCPCGHTAHYVELRSKPARTAVGEAESRRAYFLCDRCRHGQFPIDRERSKIACYKERSRGYWKRCSRRISWT